MGLTAQRGVNLRLLVPLQGLLQELLTTRRESALYCLEAWVVGRRMAPLRRLTLGNGTGSDGLNVRIWGPRTGWRRRWRLIHNVTWSFCSAAVPARPRPGNMRRGRRRRNKQLMVR